MAIILQPFKTKACITVFLALQVAGFQATQYQLLGRSYLHLWCSPVSALVCAEFCRDTAALIVENLASALKRCQSNVIPAGCRYNIGTTVNLVDQSESVYISPTRQVNAAHLP